MPELYEYVAGCRRCMGIGASHRDDPNCPGCGGTRKVVRRTRNDRMLSEAIRPAPADAKLGRIDPTGEDQ